MSPKAKNIILASLSAAFLALPLILYFLGERRSAETSCRSVKVTVLDRAKNKFVGEEDVKRILVGGMGSPEGVLVDSLNLGKIEKLVEGKSVIKDCEAFVTKDGALNLEITQRTPEVRFQNSENGWYADSEGYIFPLQRNYTSMVTVVDGQFPVKVERGFKGQVEDKAQREWLMGIVAMTRELGKGEWKNRFSQIHTSENGEITLVPASGREVFLFGQPEGVEGKLAKIEKYYSDIAPRGKAYREVDLRFRGQIVCR